MVLQLHRYSGGAVRCLRYDVEHVLNEGPLPWLPPSVAMDLMPSMRSMVVTCGLVRTGRGLTQVVSMSPKKNVQKKAARGGGFTAEERAAMKERVQELKTAARRGRRAAPADGERDVLAKIAEMPAPDRRMAERLHAIIKANAPALSPTTWYGMPAYARDGHVVCFFQSAHRFKARYATLGFSDKANLDESTMWPTAFALKALTAVEEARIVALVTKAVS